MKSGALCAVIGEVSADLMANRRLSLASGETGVPCFLIRGVREAWGFSPIWLWRMRARVPDIIATWAEVDEDRKALASLAQWRTRFTPWTNVDGADRLWLDVTGCANLVGGEEAWC